MVDWLVADRGFLPVDSTMRRVQTMEFDGAGSSDRRRLKNLVCSGLSHVPSSTPSHDDKGDQEKNDSDVTDDVRHDGKRTGDVARVRPKETDDRSHNDECDHRGQPVQNPPFGDDLSLLPGSSAPRRVEWLSLPTVWGHFHWGTERRA